MSALFDNPWFAGLLRDAEIAKLWSNEAQLVHYVRFEAAYSRALGAAGVAATDVAERAAQAIEAADLDQAAIASGVDRDGLPIPAFVKQLKEAAGADAEAVHRGATSQDVMDTALALTAKETSTYLTAQAVGVWQALGALSDAHGAKGLMGRTRMQAALPITVADRIEDWRLGLEEALERLASATEKLARIQLGGAVGDLKALGEAGPTVSAHMASALGLAACDRPWHSARGTVADYAGALSLTTGAMGKIGQDAALMAQQGVDEVALSGGGGSSAMPHKQNPVSAEVMVSLARYNAAQLGGLHQALIHEQERSGAAWTLEWMILPGMAAATAAALKLGARLVASIERIGG